MSALTFENTKQKVSLSNSPIFGRKIESMSNTRQNDIAHEILNNSEGHDFGIINLKSNSPKKEHCPLINAQSFYPFGGVCHTYPVRIQTKLIISKPGDEHEQEANRIAESIMHTPTAMVKRESCSSCEEDDSTHEIVQTKPISHQITSLDQRQEKDEGEDVQADADDINEAVDEVIMTKRMGVSRLVVNTSIENKINNSRGNGAYLPSDTLHFMENRFGSDFSDVRVHSDSHSVDLNSNLKAHAFTIGRDIYFNSGQYRPSDLEGRKLLAHELTHVLQQRGRSVFEHLDTSFTAQDVVSEHKTKKNANTLVKREIPRIRFFQPVKLARKSAEKNKGYVARVKSWIYKKQISGLRSTQQITIRQLKKAAKLLPVNIQGLVESIISVSEVVSDILISFVLAVNALAIGFVSSLLEMIIGLFKMVGGLLSGIMLGCYSLTTWNKEPFLLWLEDVWNTIKGIPSALSTAYNIWITKFNSASSDEQTQMIADFTGFIESMLIPFAKMPRYSSQVSRAGTFEKTAGKVLPELQGKTKFGGRLMNESKAISETVEGGAGSRLSSTKMQAIAERLGETASVTSKGSLIVESGGVFSASEIAAAKYLQSLGKNVILRTPKGTRAAGGTSDLLVNGVRFDVYSPTTNNVNRIISSIAKKNSQATGIIVDLSKSNITFEQLNNILLRVRKAGATNITDIIIMPK